MNRLTHAGGIVVRPSLTGPLILLVRARSTSREWVLPKGHIGTPRNPDESPESAARREVREEAGVLAEVVARVGSLSYHKGSEMVTARVFLMRYVGETSAKEDRETRWLSFEQAAGVLEHEDARSLLGKARSMVVRETSDEHHELGEKVMLKQLDLLHELMKETSAEANSFLARYLLGGLIAVLGLLNADLLLLEDNLVEKLSAVHLLLAVVALLGLSGIYFGIATHHYLKFRKSHRRIKYKFELTLHSLLLGPGGIPEEYSRRLEDSVKNGTWKKDLGYPGSGSRAEVLRYLLHHHRQRHTEIKAWYASVFFWLATLLVFLTLVIRALPFLNLV